MTKVAVIGNTSRNIGAACAADLALSGHEVRYFLFPEAAGELPALQKLGGFDVRGDAHTFFAGRTGKAVLHAICSDPKDALELAEVVLLDVEMSRLEQQFRKIIPWLPRGALVYVQSFGYWAAARLAPLLRAAGRGDVLVCEAAVPTHAASLSEGVLTGAVLRRGIEIATMPGHRVDDALKLLRTLFPDFVAAPSVLQTSLESVNLMVHPAMALLGIGVMEQAAGRGERIHFYRDCNVPSAGRLAEALDDERGRVCATYGVRHRRLPVAIDHYYGTSGDRVYDAVLNCAAYQRGFGTVPAHTWRNWELVDVSYAIAPLVMLADQAGIAAPLHRGAAEILGVVLGIDPWTSGPSLKDMDLVGSSDELAARYGGLQA